MEVGEDLFIVESRSVHTGALMDLRLETMYVPVGWVNIQLARADARRIVREGIAAANPWLKLP